MSIYDLLGLAITVAVMYGVWRVFKFAANGGKL